MTAAPPITPLSAEILRATRGTLAAALESAGAIWQPRSPVSTVDFAESDFYLPSEVADKHGRFDWYYAPAMIGVASALDDPAYTTVACMKGAQQAWTTTLLAYLSNRVINAPCGMIGVFSSKNAADSFNDQNLTPTIKATPKLLERIDVRKTRSRGNRSGFKAFPGGWLKYGGSGQVDNVKSISAPVVFVEEPDDASQNVRNQGSAISLLAERGKRQRKRKQIIGGTPSLKGLSQIEAIVDATDRRVLPVRCHDCGDSHVLDLDNVAWVDHAEAPHPIYGQADLDSVRYACPHCGSLWDDFRRQQNIRDTVHAAIASGDPYCGWTPTRSVQGAAGFTELNEAYSCLPGVGLADYVRADMEAQHALKQGDESKAIVVANARRGRSYEYQSGAADAEALEAAAWDYPEGTVPAGGLRICAGVDVQHNRLSVLLRAYGRDHESWLVLWAEPAAAVSTHNRDDAVWTELDRVLFRSYQGPGGIAVPVAAVTIDSSDGATNDAVYAWVASRWRQYRHVRIMAGKGASTDREIYSLPETRAVQPARPDRQTKADRWGVRVYSIGTWKAKDHLAARWKLEAQGRGRHHATKHVRADYWQQITSNVKAPSRRHRGRLIWQPKVGVPEEALDCEVMAEHASRSCKTHLLTPREWDAIEARLRQADLFAEAPPHDAAPALSAQTDGERAGEAAEAPHLPKPAPRRAPKAPRPAPPRRPGRGWAGNWRR